MESNFKPIMLEADIRLVDETEELVKTVASVVEFPENKTPDLLFFSGIFITSGANLNKAYFMPSELVKAAPSIDHKALDIEHAEDDIVGHIYSSKFINRAGAELDLKDLASMNENQLNAMEIEVVIAGILYKSRFPKIAEEVASGKWKLSMETYFQSYDIKVGNVIMSRKEAEALGIAAENLLGKMAKVLEKGKEIAEGEVLRVLRELLFSGCGLVKNPANPRSIILETAKKDEIGDDIEIIVDLDNLDNSQTAKAKDKKDKVKVEKDDKEDADIDIVDIRNQTSVGICVSYKRRVIDATFEGPDVKVLHENWCTKYEKGCTSFSRDVTDPNCLIHKVEEETKLYASEVLEELNSRDKRSTLLSGLKAVLKK